MKGFRMNLAQLIIHPMFGAAMAFVTLLYTLLIIIILIIEDEIYDNSTAVVIFNVSEIVLVVIFGIELILNFTAFGFKMFSDQFNILEIFLIIITIVWSSLDLSDSRKFRILGAYRLYRVALLYSKLYHTKVLHEARKKYQKF